MPLGTQGDGSLGNTRGRFSCVDKMISEPLGDGATWGRTCFGTICVRPLR